MSVVNNTTNPPCAEVVTTPAHLDRANSSLPPDGDTYLPELLHATSPPVLTRIIQMKYPALGLILPITITRFQAKTRAELVMVQPTKRHRESRSRSMPKPKSASKTTIQPCTAPLCAEDVATTDHLNEAEDGLPPVDVPNSTPHTHVTPTVRLHAKAPASQAYRELPNVDVEHLQGARYHTVTSNDVHTKIDCLKHLRAKLPLPTGNLQMPTVSVTQPHNPKVDTPCELEVDSRYDTENDPKNNTVNVRRADTGPATNVIESNQKNKETKKENIKL